MELETNFLANKYIIHINDIEKMDICGFSLPVMRRNVFFNYSHSTIQKFVSMLCFLTKESISILLVNFNVALSIGRFPGYYDKIIVNSIIIL